MDHPENASGPAPRARRRNLLIAAAVAAVAVVVATIVLWPREAPSPVASASPLPAETATAAPQASPEPTPTGFPANTQAYDLAALPQVDVFAVLPALPVDDGTGAFTGETARPSAEGAPVWSDPAGSPVAFLPQEYRYGGTTVPVIERQEHWVRVLLTGRQALPSGGNPGQVTGWLRVQDVTMGAVDAHIEVSLSARTVDIVRGGESQRVADDFASGTEETPTPLGRSFVMHVESVPEFGYTQGHPIVYLSVQSPTLDGFDGAEAAVTAFHYHDERSGAISNGCLRVGEEAIGLLSALPVGTPVIING